MPAQARCAGATGKLAGAGLLVSHGAAGHGEAMFAFSLLTVVIGPLASDGDEPAVAGEALPTATAVLRVIDRDGSPLEGYIAWTAGKRHQQVRLVEGAARLTYPTDGDVTLHIAAGGHALFATYAPHRSYAPPAEQTVAFRTTPQRLSGQLVDSESGDPVWPAEVSVMTGVTTHRSEWREQKTVPTRPDGTFVLEDVIGEAISLVATARDHGGRGLNLHIDATAMTRLVDGTFVLPMTRRQPLSGRLVDEAGKPVVGARVRLVRQYTEGDTTTSNAAGRFRFGNVAEPNTVSSDLGPTLLIGHPDYAFAVVDATKFLKRDDPTIVLEAGQAVSMRLVDPKGQPFGGALVRPRVAIGRRTISFLPPEWVGRETRSDADGWVRIPHAPKADLEFPFRWSVLGPGFFAEQLIPTAAGPTYELTPRTALRGDVVSATTGEPLDRARVWVERADGEPGKVNGFGNESVTQGPGSYSHPVQTIAEPIVVRAQRAGYEPYRSEPFTLRRGEMERSIELQPQKRLRGRIVDAVGTPVVGARVHALSSQSPLRIENGAVKETIAPDAVSGDDGTFETSLTKAPRVVVLSPTAGYAFLSPTQWQNRTRPTAEDGETKPIELQPWRTAAGRLTEAGQPLADREVTALHVDFGEGAEQFYQLANSTRTDETGAFRFDRLFGDHVLVSSPLAARTLRGEIVGTYGDYVQTVDLEAAGHLDVAGDRPFHRELSFAGRCTVQGRVSVEGLDRGLMVGGTLERTVNGAAFTTESETPGVVVRAMNVGPEGRFLCPGVLPGPYELWVMATDPQTGDDTRSVKLLITVPDADTLDLGPLEWDEM